MVYDGKTAVPGATPNLRKSPKTIRGPLIERLWRNVKYEDVYPKGYSTVEELTIGLAQYFALYNEERPHQALGNGTPALVY